MQAAQCAQGVDCTESSCPDSMPAKLSLPSCIYNITYLPDFHGKKYGPVDDSCLHQFVVYARYSLLFFFFVSFLAFSVLFSRALNP